MKEIIRNPILKTVFAILIGIFVLNFSGIFMMIISKNTSLFDDFPVIKKTFIHTAMAVLSLLIILIINKGKLKEYGFILSGKFPILKVIFVSLSFGILSVLISRLLSQSTANIPVADFTIIEKILFIWIWASICEEILTRGLIQGFLSPLKHIKIILFKRVLSFPVIVGAIFFGIMHFALLSMGVDILLVINIVIFGIILGLIAGYQREKTGSLIPAILVHFCFNVGANAIALI